MTGGHVTTAWRSVITLPAPRSGVVLDCLDLQSITSLFMLSSAGVFAVLFP